MGWLTSTVRFRITALAVVVAALVLIVASVAVVAGMERLLTENLDELLASEAAGIAGELTDADAAPSVLVGDAPVETFSQLVVDGSVVATSANSRGSRPFAAPLPDGDRLRMLSVPGLSVDDDVFRVLTRRVDLPSGMAILHVATTLDDVIETSQLLVQLLAVAVPIVVLVLGALTWWLVGRTLRPVEAIRTEVAGIGAVTLDRRVPVPSGDDEIARLARTMNRMLDRVEDGARRQSRFVADAAHELRTPLTRIRTELEVELAHPEAVDPAATRQSVLEETIGLQRTVDDLLELARADAISGSGQVDPIDLDELVWPEARRLRANGRVAVNTSGVSAVQVRGDAARIARALRNVIDNAQRHAQSVVTIALRAEGGSARLAVSDDGPGIPADQRERVFERFARLDDGRQREAGGAGLGLAIAREIVVAHGGSIRIDPVTPHGTRVTIALPLLDDAEVGTDPANESGAGQEAP